jgi:TPR repeat protein
MKMGFDELSFDPQRVRELVAKGDDEEAMRYIDQSIESGSVRAMIAKADYLFDRGDQTGSLAWIERAEKAALDGDTISPSAVLLASAYERGLGTGTRPERERKAINILERIGETGNLPVIHALMINSLYGLNGAPEDYERCIYWAKKAAALGSDAAARILRDQSKIGTTPDTNGE